MIAVHDDDEATAAEQFQSGSAANLARFMIKRQKGHNETVGHAIELFRIEFISEPIRSPRRDRAFT